METSIPPDQWEDQELDGRMWFREMHTAAGDKRMEERAANRDEWRRLMSEAKAQKWL
jgi:hypothetical protein